MVEETRPSIELTIKLATLLGWTRLNDKRVAYRLKPRGIVCDRGWSGIRPDDDGHVWAVPYFAKDLNAIHEAENKVMFGNPDLSYRYAVQLEHTCSEPHRATAMQRCGALIAALEQTKTTGTQ